MADKVAILTFNLYKFGITLAWSLDAFSDSPGKFFSFHGVGDSACTQGQMAQALLNEAQAAKEERLPDAAPCIGKS